MKKTFLAAVACAFAVTACSQLREPSDAQLTTLLRTPRSAPGDAAAPLDSVAITCLRTWSGDASLVTGMAPGATSDAAKGACRGKIDGWISQADRNPDKLRFEDVSAPAAVKRAIALQSARNVAASSGHDIPPEVMSRPIAPPPPMAPTPSTVDMGAAGADLADAETQCHEAAVRASSGGNPRLQGFAVFCAKSLKQLRSNMEAVAKAGNSARLEAMVTSARNLAANGRNLLAASNGK